MGSHSPKSSWIVLIDGAFLVIVAVLVLIAILFT